MNKTNLDQLIQGGKQTLLNAIFVSLCGLSGIIALIVILLTK